MRGQLGAEMTPLADLAASLDIPTTSQINVEGLKSDHVLATLWNHAQDVLKERRANGEDLRPVDWSFAEDARAIEHHQYNSPIYMKYHEARTVLGQKEHADGVVESCALRGRTELAIYNDSNVREHETVKLDLDLSAMQAPECETVDCSGYDALYGRGAARAALSKLRQDLQPIDISHYPKAYLYAALIDAVHRMPCMTYASAQQAVDTIEGRNDYLLRSDVWSIYTFADLHDSPTEVSPVGFDEHYGQGTYRQAVETLNENLAPINIEGINRRRLVREVIIELERDPELAIAGGATLDERVTAACAAKSIDFVNNGVAASIDFSRNVVRPEEFDQALYGGSGKRAMKEALGALNIDLNEIDQSSAREDLRKRWHEERLKRLPPEDGKERLAS
ncbi:hypothetical protein OAO01_02755 [Oligoflexia bacterium]|nr:hypothetical protein [Oligoflexia bacterium]